MLRVATWSVVVYCGLGLLGFAVLAGFWPPPGEYLGAVDIAAYFREHETAIRIGMVMMAMGAPFYFVWSAALSKIIGRIEGPMGVLSTVELLGGLLTAIVTLVPPTIWLTAALRAGTRTDGSIQLFYDFGWIFFDLTFMCSVLQSVALGLAILRDRRPIPLFPRWVAWVAFLVAATYFPLVFVPFFTDGPFAWHGLISFWAVFVMFFVLIAIVTPYALKALRTLETEMTTSA
ncbi:hypothetical protein B1790_04325 [Mycobacterium sp. AT1]|nr:hypothetical protein B1790_04325 [Mycobacterium sp. AT1]